MQMREKLFESTMENLKVVVNLNYNHELMAKIYFYDSDSKHAYLLLEKIPLMRMQVNQF